MTIDFSKLLSSNIVWKISTFGYVEGGEYFFDNKFMALGSWRPPRTPYDEGNLRDYEFKEELREVFNKQKEHLYDQDEEDRPTTTSADYFWKFANEVEIGDVAVAYAEKKILGLGFVISDYYFVNSDSPHRRKVGWMELKPHIANTGAKEVKSLQRPPAFFKLDEQTVKQVIGLITKK